MSTRRPVVGPPQRLTFGRKVDETPVTELSFPSVLPGQFRMPDGRLVEVTLEKAQPSEVAVTSAGDPVLFAPDPDIFNTDQEGDTCRAFLAKSGQVTAVSFDVQGYRSQYGSIPLYLVGYRDVDGAGSQSGAPGVAALPDTGGGGGGGGGGTGGCPPGGTTPYVLVTDIREKTGHDPWSNEEFTVFPSQQGEPTAYSLETTLVFDGHTHTDAAGRSVYFADINDTWVTYHLASCGIAFLRLENGVDKGFIAIENDTDPQTIHHSTMSNPPGFPTEAFKYQNVDVQYATGGASWGVPRKFYFWWFSNSINSDDVITSGAYEKFSAAWDPGGRVVHFALNDNDFWATRQNF